MLSGRQDAQNIGEGWDHDPARDEDRQGMAEAQAQAAAAERQPMTCSLLAKGHWGNLDGLDGLSFVPDSDPDGDAVADTDEDLVEDE